MKYEEKEICINVTVDAVEAHSCVKRSSARRLVYTYLQIVQIRTNLSILHSHADTAFL